MVSCDQLSKTELCLDPSRKGTDPQIAALGRLPIRLFGEIPTRDGQRPAPTGQRTDRYVKRYSDRRIDIATDFPTLV